MSQQARGFGPAFSYLFYRMLWSVKKTGICVLIYGLTVHSARDAKGRCTRRCCAHPGTVPYFTRGRRYKSSSPRKTRSCSVLGIPTGNSMIFYKTFEDAFRGNKIVSLKQSMVRLLRIILHCASNRLGNVTIPTWPCDRHVHCRR